MSAGAVALTAAWAVRVGLPAASGPPLDPSAAAGRELARRELARPEYARQAPGLVERLWTALGDLLDRVRVPSGSSPWHLVALVAVLVALAVAVVLAVRATGRAGLRRSARTGTAVSTTRSVAALRAAADAAAAAGDLRLAVTERFRALVRALELRDLVRSSPGLTAAEAATQGGQALPVHAERLRAAGSLFDAVVYGRAVPVAADDERLAALDADLARTRPSAVHGSPPHDGAHDTPSVPAGRR